MNKLHIYPLLTVIMVIPIVLGFSTGSGAGTQGKAVLSAGDCSKCHAGPPADIASGGAGHMKVSCIDCHAGHRPESSNNIPKCSQCHSGKPHFDLKECLGCHRNPHIPLKISFGNNVTDPCLSCHSGQIKELRDNRSKHSLLFCTTCHFVHNIAPQCVNCHKPHSKIMTQTDCKKCHKAHMPKVVTYGTDIPNKDCESCHQKAQALLSTSKSRHKTLTCVFCHASRHKSVPACQSCHGVPHSAAFMAKFSKCNDCHYIAHDLDNWPGTPNK